MPPVTLTIEIAKTRKAQAEFACFMARMSGREPPERCEVCQGVKTSHAARKAQCVCGDWEADDV